MHGGFSILPLRVENLTYSVGGRTFLEGVSFDIGPGGRTVIMGPNGAGKSLTLRLCHGLLRPSAGTVTWSGPAGTAISPDRQGKKHAMVFQRPVLLRRNALGNLTHALALRSAPRQVRLQRARDALKRFGLLGLADRPARLLSGGEQQRLAIARAWALQPEVLFLDEPTAALDPAAMGAVEAMITAFAAAGVTVVMTTHDLGQARRIADRVLFLHNGRLLEDSPANAFFERPSSEAGQAFIRGELLW